jgi:hypothetical protein
MENLMKKTSIFFLCCSFLLYSCYPWTPLTQEDKTEQSQFIEEDIIVTLVDGSVIKSRPYRHFYTTEPDDCIFGYGRKRHRFVRAEHIEFTGKLERVSIDSLKFIGSQTLGHLLCYLPDSIDIYFNSGDYIIVTPDQPAGLWCAGILTANDKDSIFNGRIPQDRIKSIEMREFSASQTYLLLGCGVLVAGIIVFLIALSKMSNIKNFNLK